MTTKIVETSRHAEQFLSFVINHNHLPNLNLSPLPEFSQEYRIAAVYRCRPVSRNKMSSCRSFRDWLASLISNDMPHSSSYPFFRASIAITTSNNPLTMTAPPAANGERGRVSNTAPSVRPSVRPPSTIVIGHVPCRTRLRLSPPLARQSAASLLLHPSSRERQGFHKGQLSLRSGGSDA